MKRWRTFRTVKTTVAVDHGAVTIEEVEVTVTTLAKDLEAEETVPMHPLGIIVVQRSTILVSTVAGDVEN